MQHRKIAVIGLGYVGLPVAIAFGQKDCVIAFDINQKRINELKNHIDLTREVSEQELKSSKLFLTSEPKDLQKADFFIVAVPTPIDSAKHPDLTLLLKASKTIGAQLKKNDIVVYESTVYPGVTEDECVPILEEYSGLKFNKDFFVGYSPERINPGDKNYCFTNIKKVVSGSTVDTLNIVADVYGSVVTAGIYKAKNIKTAEAAKVIENTQRDINIALINELALIFNKLNIDTHEVLEAAGTKWNFLPFKPGLVGGHCIGVDPYYLTYKAKKIGLNPEVILAGRRTNDNMGKYVAEQTIKQLVKNNKPVNGAKVAIFGLTFKENCPDLRNSKVFDIVKELQDYHIDVVLHDPIANFEEAKEEYNVNLMPLAQIKNVDALIMAVAHKYYFDLPVNEIANVLCDPKIIIDIKNIFAQKNIVENKFSIWRL